MREDERLAGARAALRAATALSVDDDALLLRALTHASYANEHPGTRDNERLEFLGDAVLQLGSSKLLYDRLTGEEFALTEARKALVNNGRALPAIGRRLGIKPFLRVGGSVGEPNDGILACASEAILGALALDRGHGAAVDAVIGLLEHAVRDGELVVDPTGEQQLERAKNRLQELLEPHRIRVHYEERGEGPDHERTWTVHVHLQQPDGRRGRSWGEATDRTKKEAGKKAALMAWAALHALPPESWR